MMEKLFGRWSELVTSVLLSLFVVEAILVTCGCCCIPTTMYNVTIQSRPCHNSAHVTTTPLVRTPPPSQPKMRRYNLVLVRTTPLVTTPPSSQLHPGHNHTPPHNSAPVTTTPLVTNPPSSHLLPCQNHTPPNNSAPVTTTPLVTIPPSSQHVHLLHHETLQSRRQNSTHVTTTPLVTTPPPSQPKMRRYNPVLVTATPL